MLAQCAQLVVFFSLLGSLITTQDPNDPTMAVLLPGLLVVAFGLFAFFQVRILFSSAAVSARFADVSNWLRHHAIACLDGLLCVPVLRSVVVPTPSCQNDATSQDAL